MASTPDFPKVSRSLCLTKSTEGPFPYESVIRDVPVSPLKEGQVLVRMGAAAFNHRELWQLKNLYPGTTPDTVMGADGAGIVVDAYDQSEPLMRKKVFLVPMIGWESDPYGPESRFGILGGISAGGTFTEFIAVDRKQVIIVPDHLPLVYAAAWPVAGVTSWRAVKIKADVKVGDNVLITGIGGGVALTALQLCVALGANVFVTTSSPEKLEKARALGAMGGVNYKTGDWGSQLAKLLQEVSSVTGKKPLLQAVIDSAGGDIIAQLGKLFDHGARVVCYGMTVEPTIPFTMREVLRNIELKAASNPFHLRNIVARIDQILGSTMGSTKDLADATAFIAHHKIVPEVSHVLRGLDEAKEGFELMASGSRLGKIVIKFPGRTPDGDVRT